MLIINVSHLNIEGQDIHSQITEGHVTFPPLPDYGRICNISYPLDYGKLSYNTTHYVICNVFGQIWPPNSSSMNKDKGNANSLPAHNCIVK